MPDDRDGSQASHNRIFILASRDCAEDDLRESFEKFGSIKDLYIVKDRKSREPKGIVYITYSKSSEAALAIEEMNGKPLANHPKPIKVLMAADRRDGATRESKEDEKLLRLFLKIPRSYTEEDVRDKFKQYGEIDSVRILTDRQSGDSKGLAYVKFYRAYHAALALENCDVSYRPVFAESSTVRRAPPQAEQRYNDHQMDYSYAPRASGSNYSTASSTDYYEPMNSPQGNGRPSHVMSPLDMMRPYNEMPGECALEVMASTTATPEQLRLLMDLIPGFQYCDFDRLTGVAYVRYSSSKCAAYAKEKLNGFEYPTGYRLSVRYPGGQSGGQSAGAGDGYGRHGRMSGGDPYATGPSTSMSMSTMAGNLSSASASDLVQNIQALSQSADPKGNLQDLVASIEKATAVLQQAGIYGGAAPNTMGSPMGNTMGNTMGASGDVRVRYCNVALPEQKALAPRDSPMEQRLFIVSQPERFDESILKDSFGRFGNLIDAYFMPGRNYGYAKFANRDNALVAMNTLHGQEVCGMRLKVLEAEPPKQHDDDGGNKRPRT